MSRAHVGGVYVRFALVVNGGNARTVCHQWYLNFVSAVAQLAYPLDHEPCIPPRVLNRLCACAEW